MPRDIASFRLYQAIQRQPEELARILVAPEPVDLAAQALAHARRVFTIGIGTSWNAACAATWLLRAAGLEAQPWSSHDFAGYPPNASPEDAAMLFTHSGAKAYSRSCLDLLGERRVPTVLVTSTESAITQRDVPMNTTILRTTTREQSSMFTVSHTVAMLLAARVADAIRPGAAGDLGAVPDAVGASLRLEPEVRDLAAAWFARRAIVALGAGPHEVSAHEAVIKIAEAARRATRAHAVEQFLHGPQVQVQADEAFLLFAGDGPGLPRTRQAAEFVRTLGCDAVWLSPVASPDGVAWLPLPDAGELLAPIIEAVPAQILAGHLAALADVDGDVFRTDDPVFKAARDAIAL
jgi:glutamine---fructose-6-phosphate transaminase (isomerizing)